MSGLSSQRADDLARAIQARLADDQALATLNLAPETQRFVIQRIPEVIHEALQADQEAVISSQLAELQRVQLEHALTYERLVAAEQRIHQLEGLQLSNFSGASSTRSLHEPSDNMSSSHNSAERIAALQAENAQLSRNLQQCRSEQQRLTTSLMKVDELASSAHDAELKFARLGLQNMEHTCQQQAELIATLQTKLRNYKDRFNELNKDIDNQTTQHQLQLQLVSTLDSDIHENLEQLHSQLAIFHDRALTSEQKLQRTLQANAQTIDAQRQIRNAVARMFDDLRTECRELRSLTVSALVAQQQVTDDVVEALMTQVGTVDQVFSLKKKIKILESQLFETQFDEVKRARRAAKLQENRMNGSTTSVNQSEHEHDGLVSRADSSFWDSLGDDADMDGSQSSDLLALEVELGRWRESYEEVEALLATTRRNALLKQQQLSQRIADLEATLTEAGLPVPAPLSDQTTPHAGVSPAVSNAGTTAGVMASAAVLEQKMWNLVEAFDRLPVIGNVNEAGLHGSASRVSSSDSASRARETSKLKLAVVQWANAENQFDSLEAVFSEVHARLRSFDRELRDANAELHAKTETIEQLSQMIDDMHQSENSRPTFRRSARGSTTSEDNNNPAFQAERNHALDLLDSTDRTAVTVDVLRNELDRAIRRETDLQEQVEALTLAKAQSALLLQQQQQQQQQQPSPAPRSAAGQPPLQSQPSMQNLGRQQSTSLDSNRVEEYEEKIEQLQETVDCLRETLLAQQESAAQNEFLQGFGANKQHADEILLLQNQVLHLKSDLREAHARLQLQANEQFHQKMHKSKSAPAQQSLHNNLDVKMFPTSNELRSSVSALNSRRPSHQLEAGSHEHRTLSKLTSNLSIGPPLEERSSPKSGSDDSPNASHRKHVQLAETVSEVPNGHLLNEEHGDHDGQEFSESDHDGHSDDVGEEFNEVQDHYDSAHDYPSRIRVAAFENAEQNEDTRLVTAERQRTQRRSHVARRHSSMASGDINLAFELEQAHELISSLNQQLDEQTESHCYTVEQIHEQMRALQRELALVRSWFVTLYNEHSATMQMLGDRVVDLDLAYEQERVRMDIAVSEAQTSLRPENSSSTDERFSAAELDRERLQREVDQLRRHETQLAEDLCTLWTKIQLSIAEPKAQLSESKQPLQLIRELDPLIDQLNLRVATHASEQRALQTRFTELQHRAQEMSEMAETWAQTERDLRSALEVSKEEREKAVVTAVQLVKRSQVEFERQIFEATQRFQAIEKSSFSLVTELVEKTKELKKLESTLRERKDKTRLLKAQLRRQAEYTQIIEQRLKEISLETSILQLCKM